MKFSVIIAAHNEGAQISSSLRRLREISQAGPMEIILVDGGSDDDTVEQARDWVDELIVLDKPNRGAQLHAGAQKASGDLLFFLRADAQPPGNWQQALEHFWLAEKHKKIAATVFGVDYGSGAAYRLAASLANFSAKHFGCPSGDNGFCTSPQNYRESGGFPPYAVMEDVVFAQRLSRLGGIAVLEDRIWSAARRMHGVGPVRSLFYGYWQRLCFKLGASPEYLAGR